MSASQVMRLIVVLVILMAPFSMSMKRDGIDRQQEAVLIEVHSGEVRRLRNQVCIHEID
jgi:hypothetical protein